MLHRLIGQQRLGFAAGVRSSSSLGDLVKLIDWNPVIELLAGIYANTKGEVARPPPGIWARDEAETLQKLKDWNQRVRRVQGRIDKISGTWKRSYDLRRMRWRGIAKAACQIHPTAIACNLKRTFNIIHEARWAPPLTLTSSPTSETW